MNRQKREQQILDASLRVFARQGYENTSVSGLVKEAQVSRGTFYLYFKSKKEIFDTLIDRFMLEVLHYASLFDATQMQENKAEFSTLGQDLSGCLTRYRLLARVIMVNSRGLMPSHRAKIDGYTKQCYRVLEQNIENGVRLGEFKDVDANVMARCLVGTIKEFILEWSSDNESYDIESKVSGFFMFVLQTLKLPTNSRYITSSTTQDGGSFIEREVVKSSYI